METLRFLSAKWHEKDVVICSNFSLEFRARCFFLHQQSLFADKRDDHKLLTFILFFSLFLSFSFFMETAKNVGVRNRNLGNVRKGQTEERRFVRPSDGDHGQRDGVRNGRGGFGAQSGVFRALGVGETGVSSRVFKRRVEGFEVRGIFFVENFVGSGD
jgi:hypothetical protein